MRSEDGVVGGEWGQREGGVAPGPWEPAVTWAELGLGVLGQLTRTALPPVLYLHLPGQEFTRCGLTPFLEHWSGG